MFSFIEIPVHWPGALDLYPLLTWFSFFQGPLAIRLAKKAINKGAEVADTSSALAVEGECYELLLHTQDRIEALDAFAEKRKPVYTGK